MVLRRCRALLRDEERALDAMHTSRLGQPMVTDGAAWWRSGSGAARSTRSYAGSRAPLGRMLQHRLGSLEEAHYTIEQRLLTDCDVSAL